MSRTAVIVSNAEDSRALCRLCMIHHEYLVNIFIPNDAFRICAEEAIQDLLNLKVAVGDGLPSNICHQCVNKLMEFRDFKDMCLKTAAELRKYYLDNFLRIKVEDAVDPETSRERSSQNNKFQNDVQVTEVYVTVPDELAMENICHVKGELVSTENVSVEEGKINCGVHCTEGDMPVTTLTRVAIDPLAVGTMSIKEEAEEGEELVATVEGKHSEGISLSEILATQASTPILRQLEFGNMVAKDDNLPKMACCPCVTKLMEFREFKEMCMNSAREFGRHAPLEPNKCPLEGEGTPVRLMDGGEGADVEKKSPNRNEACDPLAFDNLCPVKEEFLPMQLCGEATSGMWSNSVGGESRLPVAPNDLSLDSFAPENQTDTKDVFLRDPLGESDDCGEENFAETHFNEDAAVYSESKQLLTVDQVDHCYNIGGKTEEPEKESDKCDADRKRTSQNKELGNPSSSPTHEENLQLKYLKPNSFFVDCFPERRVKQQKKNVKFYAPRNKLSQLNDRERPVRNHECEKLGHQAENTSDPTEYICSYCNARYSEIYSLALHIKIHVDGMRSASALPKKEFSPRFSQNLLVKAFKCIECGKTFSRSSELYRHSDVHTGVKRFKCNECGKMFAERSTLKSHLLVHTGVKQFKCNECGKMFTQSGHLKSHLLVHTGVKQFKCNECGKTFSRKGHLNAHSVVHTGVKRFKCNECGKTFSRKGNLNEHSVVHTGVKRFKCNECGKMFTKSSDLKRHSVIHTGVKPFKCNYCGELFKWRSGLNRHLLFHADQNPSK